MGSYNSTRQYEPITIPSEASASERRAWQRLTEILDDIYLKYGRLTIKDFAKTTVQAINAAGVFDSAQIKDLQATLARFATAEIGSATITNAQIGTLSAQMINGLRADLERADIEEAQIENLTAQALTAIKAKMEECVAGTISAAQMYADIFEATQGIVGDLRTQNFTSAVANISYAQIATLVAQSADIDFARIKDLVSDKAIITQGTGGKLYIADLAVTDANMLSLTVGQLVVKGEDDRYYQLVVDPEAEKGFSLREVEMDGDQLVDNTIPGGKIVENSITARELNVETIFADEALIRELIAGIGTFGEIFATSAVMPYIQANVIDSEALLVKIRENSAGAYVSDTPPEAVTEGMIWTDTGVTPPLDRLWVGGTTVTDREYAGAETGSLIRLEALPENTDINVSGSITYATQEADANGRTLAGFDRVTLKHSGKNLLDIAHMQTTTNVGVTMTPDPVAGTMTISGKPTLSSATVRDFTIIPSGTALLPPGAYVLTGCPAGGSDYTYRLYFRIQRKAGNYAYLSDYGQPGGKAFVMNEGDTLWLTLRFGNEYDGSELVFRPMIEPGSVATEFSPYVGGTYEHSFGETVYRGQYDLPNHRLTITHKMFELRVSDMNNSDDYPGWKGVEGLTDCFTPGTAYTWVSSTASNLSDANGRFTVTNSGILFLPTGIYKLTQTQWKAQYPDMVVQILYPLLEPKEIGLGQTDMKAFQGTNVLQSTLPVTATFTASGWRVINDTEGLGNLVTQHSSQISAMQDSIALRVTESRLEEALGGKADVGEISRVETIFAVESEKVEARIEETRSGVTTLQTAFSVEVDGAVVRNPSQTNNTMVLRGNSMTINAPGREALVVSPDDSVMQKLRVNQFRMGNRLTTVTGSGVDSRIVTQYVE